MGIVLTSPISRGSDSTTDIRMVGINYDSSKVIVRIVLQPSGDERDFVFEGPSLTALRNAVSNFSGLRVALLQYLQTLDSTLSGGVS